MTITPSLPAASYKDIESLAQALRGEATQLQIDIVDGQFVEAISWPFTESDPIGSLRHLAALTPDFSLEIDCMVMEPVQYFPIFKEIGVSRVIIHVGSCADQRAAAEAAKEHGWCVGLAFTNDVPLADVKSLLDVFAYVQVMGIAEVGKQGQPFDDRTFETVRNLRAEYPELEIAVDGSVNLDTIGPLKAAGVTRFAPGSAIAKQADPLAAYQELRSMVL